jgi:hypothetical protein
MFEGSGSPELAGEPQEELATYSSQVVLVDRSWLAPAWRGHGAGGLLTARLLGSVCPDPMVVDPAPERLHVAAMATAHRLHRRRLCLSHESKLRIHLQDDC